MNQAWIPRNQGPSRSERIDASPDTIARGFRAMKKLAAAVLGAGYLGRHHARVYAGLPGVRLAAVVDIDRARAEEVAARHGARAFASTEELLASGVAIDLASVAVPTRSHHDVAIRLIDRQIAVLVEKPMTPTVTEARSLTKAARERGVCLQAGHVERFNPALRAAKALRIEPRFIESHRLAPFSFRSADVGVVLDLMIHDLDIVLELVPAPLTDVRAVGGSMLTGGEDVASAHLEFADGTVAHLTTSRVSMIPVRRTRVFSRDSYLSMDFGKKYALVARKAAGFPEKLSAKWAEMLATPIEQMRDTAASAFRDLIEIQELTLDDEEPLHAELRSFVGAVRERTPPEVSAEQALRALEAAEFVLREVQKHPW
jgi:predicted dehydrogenase